MIERSSVRGWSRSVALAVLTLASPGWLVAAGETPTAAVPASARVLNAAESRLKADVAFLADDAREGRAPGTPGIEAAADYIAAAFKEAGLKPAPGAEGYFQPFTISGQAKLGKPPSLDLRRARRQVDLDREQGRLHPAGASASAANARARADRLRRLRDHGQGRSKKLDYDDYAGLDVKGKAVLILRREPRQDRRRQPVRRQAELRSTPPSATRRPTPFSTARRPCCWSTTWPGSRASKDELLGFSDGRDRGRTRTLPFLMLTRAFADKLLAERGRADARGAREGRSTPT